MILQKIEYLFRWCVFSFAQRFSPIVPDKLFLKIVYRKMMGEELNLNNPRTFNEKLQWLKLYDRKPEYTRMVDKYEAKNYVASIIGVNHIIPTLAVYNSVDEIDFEALPNQFVLKCTHDSGGVVVCKDKLTFDRRNALEKLRDGLKRNFYYQNREWPYKNVKPRIIAEQYKEDSSGGLIDYKLMCFNGCVKCSFVVTNRHQESPIYVDFYDRDWNHLPFSRHYLNSNKEVKRPVNYNKMIQFAEKLSKGIPFVRVDFYEVENKVYFGEMTFYPGSGFEEFKPKEWDAKLGDMIDISLIN